MNFAIIGMGFIGSKRARSLQSDDRLIFCVDTDINKAKELASQYGAKSLSNYKDAFTPEIDIVIVSTNNSNLFPVAMCAIKNKKHVLIEKPAGINSFEIGNLIKASNFNEYKIWVGYNHRYHSGVRKADELIRLGCIGNILFCRGLYGHDGRLGMAKEWRSNVGELIDQGSHLIDLSAWFFGIHRWKEVYGKTDTFFWSGYKNDNAFITLSNNHGQTAFLHASCTEWRNMFQFEIYGDSGKIRVDGLGGSYGIEKTTLYQMKPDMGLPEITSWEFPEEDISWTLELIDFKKAIKTNSLPASNIYDAYQNMLTIEKIEKQNDHNS